MFQATVEILSQVFVVVLSLNALIVPPVIVYLLYRLSSQARHEAKHLRVCNKAAKVRERARL